MSGWNFNKEQYMKAAVQSNRGSGRTRAQLESIPPEGGIYIVPNPALKLYVQTMIADLWGAERLRAICVIVFANGHDARRIAGHRPPVVVDHAVWDMLDGERAEALRVTVQECNRIYP